MHRRVFVNLFFSAFLLYSLLSLSLSLSCSLAQYTVRFIFLQLLLLQLRNKMVCHSMQDDKRETEWLFNFVIISCFFLLLLHVLIPTRPLCLYKQSVHVPTALISMSDRCVNLRELKAQLGYSYVQKPSYYSTSQYSSSLRHYKVASPFTYEIFFHYYI